MSWPTALIIGDGAEAIARKALPTGRGERPLLVVWHSTEPVAGGAGQRALQPPRRRRRRLVVDVTRTPGSAEEVLELLAHHAGPVAIAAPGARDAELDRVMPAVDEVVALLVDDPPYRCAVETELTPLCRRLVLRDPPPRSWRARVSGAEGQASVALLAIVAGAMAVAVALGLVANALGRSADVQGRADVAALAGAAALRDAQALLYSADPRERISVAEVRRRALVAARRTALANGLRLNRVRFQGREDLPTRIEVVAIAAGARGTDRGHAARAVAEVAVGAGVPAAPGIGEYPGPFAVRQGQRMRPDVALAFDRMQRAATSAGHPLVVVSAFRSDAEQAALFRAHPDPKWVAPPGKSLHRLGTELDLGPNAAWGWLAANAKRYGFVQRYSWEAWHFGFAASPGSASVGYRSREPGGGERATGAMPSFVPVRYAPIISRASQRWSVGAALLAAQLYQESKFDPNAISPVGAAGIAQFMVGTAATYGLSAQERFDPTKAIPAQAHLMHDLLRQFASVPLALAAYNAGPGNVAKCMCVPAIPETQGYVQSILALLGGAGIAAPAGLDIRLVA